MPNGLRQQYIEKQKRLPGADPLEIQRQEELRRGYRLGTEPTPPVRQIGPAGLTAGALSDAEKERRRRAKVAAGIPLGQEEVQ
jgi:hypothetical protein